MLPPHSTLASAVQIGGLPVAGSAPAVHGLVFMSVTGPLGVEAKPRGEDMRYSMVEEVGPSTKGARCEPRKLAVSGAHVLSLLRDSHARDKERLRAERDEKQIAS